jgi:hypothetical protein
MPKAIRLLSELIALQQSSHLDHALVSWVTICSFSVETHPTDRIRHLSSICGLRSACERCFNWMALSMGPVSHSRVCFLFLVS